MSKKHSENLLQRSRPVTLRLQAGISPGPAKWNGRKALHCLKPAEGLAHWPENWKPFSEFGKKRRIKRILRAIHIKYPCTTERFPCRLLSLKKTTAPEHRSEE